MADNCWPGAGGWQVLRWFALGWWLRCVGGGAGHPGRQGGEGAGVGPHRGLPVLPGDGRVRVERQHGAHHEGAGAEGQQHELPTCLPRRRLEINPDNAIVRELRRRTDEDKSDKTVKDLVLLLYETGTPALPGISARAPTAAVALIAS